MAKYKISALNALVGADLDTSADLICVVDTGATVTKKMTIDEFIIGIQDQFGAIESTSITTTGNGTIGGDLEVTGTIEALGAAQEITGSITSGTALADFLEKMESIGLITDNTYDAPDETIFGVSWDKSDDPTLTRTDDSVGFTAEAGVDGSSVTNDFDDEPIYSEMLTVVDSLGNYFVRIPKFYIKKTDGASSKTWQISKAEMSGCYLPACFWDFDNMEELEYVYVGKYLGYINGASLESKPDLYPTINTNIVDFRTAAEDNNGGALAGYQQMDIHTYDMLQTLFYVEFATLNSQSIMAGFTEGRYSAADLLTADTAPAGNTLVVSNATGALYEIGQAISVGTTLGGNERFYGRTITNIQADAPGAGSTTITFDGASAALTTGDILYNTGMRTGFSSAIAASSGSIDSNSSGLFSFKYRGIESLYGDVFQFVDGINIEADHQPWICRDADDYASNLFASPYEELSYGSHNASGYAVTMGWDSDNPFCELPTSVAGGANNKYYCDYYYQNTGNRVAPVGGSWRNGSYAGLSCWSLSSSSASTSVNVGARLFKKAL
jgi:hypothetical protein